MRRLSLLLAVVTGFFLWVSVPVVRAATSTAATATSSVEVAAPVSSDKLSSDGEGGSASDQGGLYERARVEEAGLKTLATDQGGQQVEAYKVKFLAGPLKDQERLITNDVGSNPYGLKPRTGDVVVVFMQSTGQSDWQLYLDGFDRRAALAWLVVLFVFTLVLLSGWQGLKVALSILISILVIAYVLIPAFVKGVNPVPLAILLSGVLTFISTGLTTGWNRKSMVTAVGTMGGALTAYAIARIFADWSHLDGLASEEDRLFFLKNPLLDPRGLLFAGIIIAATGVVEDVAVSIASGVSEVRRANPRLPFRQLFTSGMIVGKDHMGALANTLVYAYVGGSLSTLLLYDQFGGSWLKFVNFDSVVDEVIRSLAGTIGLVFTVPITALLAAWAMQREPIPGAQEPLEAPHLGHRH
jgi:uncharacterized membrane protein